MKPRRDFIPWWLHGAGLVLAMALVWSWWLARPRAVGSAVSFGAVPAGGPDLGWIAGGGAGPEAEVQRRGWTADREDRHGLFDRPGTRVSPAWATTGIRRREVELVATRELPFRLQLIGHFGEGANLSGIFAAEGMAGPLLAQGGEELPELGLRVESIVSGAVADETPAQVVARIWDRRTDRGVELPESVRARSGIGAALLAPAGFPGEAIELLAGEVVEVGGSAFRVESIRVSPAMVRLRRLAAEPDDEVEELALPPDEDSES